jgi:hypothetical protein
MTQGDVLELLIFIILAGMGFAYPGQKHVWFSVVGILLLNHVAVRIALLVLPPMAAVAVMAVLDLYLIVTFFPISTAIGSMFAVMVAGALLTFAGYLSPLPSNGLTTNFWSVFSIACFVQDLVMVAAFFTNGVTIGGKQ